MKSINIIRDWLTWESNETGYLNVELNGHDPELNCQPKGPTPHSQVTASQIWYLLVSFWCLEICFGSSEKKKESLQFLLFVYIYIYMVKLLEIFKWNG